METKLKALDLASLANMPIEAQVKCLIEFLNMQQNHMIAMSRVISGLSKAQSQLTNIVDRMSKVDNL